MATKQSTPVRRSRRNPQTTAAPPGPSTPLRAGLQFEALRDHIEAQRSRLMDAEAVLDCVICAVDEDARLESPGPSYANVVRIVRNLIHATIDQLDTVNIRAGMTRSHDDVDVPAGTSDDSVGVEHNYPGVKEPSVQYMH